MSSSKEGLAAFLAARLAEDEAAARRVEGTWRLDAPGTGVIIAEDYGDGAEPCANAFWGGVGEHIARHDPARVLREVAAKRKRLALYLAAREALAAALKKAPSEDDPAAAHSYVRERINVNQAAGRFTALEMSVRLDATTWSDHPDYRPEWKP